MQYVVAFIFILWGTLATASTGRITDGATGEPIAGATVYARWHYTPFAIPLPIEGMHYPPGKLCGGGVVAITNADGYYDLSVKIHVHETHLWVFAQGYYNDWQGPPPDDEHDFAKILSSLQWDPSHKQKDRWSKQLTPLGNASIDAKLLILARTMAIPYEHCEGGRGKPPKVPARR